jgi:hypothetical protein
MRQNSTPVRQIAALREYYCTILVTHYEYLMKAPFRAFLLAFGIHYAPFARKLKRANAWGYANEK